LVSAPPLLQCATRDAALPCAWHHLPDCTPCPPVLHWRCVSRAWSDAPYAPEPFGARSAGGGAAGAVHSGSEQMEAAEEAAPLCQSMAISRLHAHVPGRMSPGPAWQKGTAMQGDQVVYKIKQRTHGHTHTGYVHFNMIVTIRKWWPNEHGLMEPQNRQPAVIHTACYRTRRTAAVTGLAAGLKHVSRICTSSAKGGDWRNGR
jgi:hypothetical protein